MNNKELFKRILDHMSLLVLGVLLMWQVVAIAIFGRITLFENSASIRALDAICVLALIGYAIYRFRDLYTETK